MGFLRYMFEQYNGFPAEARIKKEDNKIIIPKKDKRIIFVCAVFFCISSALLLYVSIVNGENDLIVKLIVRTLIAAAIAIVDLFKKKEMEIATLIMIGVFVLAVFIL